MNKQQRYLSLLLLAKTVSGAQAMELVEAAPQTDMPNQEEVKDKFAILQPRLTQAHAQELCDTMDMFVTDDNTAVITAAYKAALERELDMHPMQRDKTVVTDRKDLWEALKKAHGTTDAAKLAINYLTGSEDEKETVDPVNPFNPVVKRVHRRDAHVLAQAAESQKLATQKANFQLEERKRALELSKLLATKQPLTETAAEIDKQAQVVRDAQELNSSKQAVIRHLAKWSKVCVQNEPLLADTDPELLKPILAGKLTEDEQKLAVELAKLVALKVALDTQITPLTEKEELLNEQQKQNLAIQADLAYKLTGLKEATEYAQLDRTKLLIALDQELVIKTQRKQDLEKVIAEVYEAVKQEPSDIDKTSVSAQLPPKFAELAETQAIISHIKVARSQADGTYTRTKWLLGYYK